MNEILIGISTYNEIKSLPTLIEQIGQHLPVADILVVDDGSPDGTGGWCQQQAQARSDFFCIERSRKLGLGTATVAALRYAIDRGYRFVINMDADLSHPPRYLPQLVNAMHDGVTEFDVAVGSRYVQGGSIVGWPLRRRVMSRCVNAFARVALGLPTRDCSGAFRCYRVSKLEQISLNRIRSAGYSFFEEILWHLRHAGAEFVEVPIEFCDRVKGESKINLCEAITALRIIGSLSFGSPTPISETHKT